MTERSGAWWVLRVTMALVMLVATSYAADWLLRTENFPVQHLRFEGPFRHVRQAELEAATLDLVRGNFFLVDLDTVQSRVEALPWVHRAAVRRTFPRDISIQFTEERLVARWTENAWVNADGEVVRVAADDLPADVPRLAGPDDTSAEVLTAYRDFTAALAPLHFTLAKLTLTPRRSWRLELQGATDDARLTLVLDHEQARPRLERFVRTYGATLASQAGAIRQVDLRYTNGFAVEWSPTRAAARVATQPAVRHEG